MSYFAWLLAVDLDQLAVIASLPITLKPCSVNPIWNNSHLISGSESRPAAPRPPSSLKQRATVDLSLTCSVPSVIEIHSEGAGLVSSLPGGRRAVFVVGVDVVVVHILPSQHGGTWWAAHRGGYKCIDKRGPSILHNPPGFVHHL